MTIETEKGIVRYQSDHGEVQLSIKTVKMCFCPLATDIEAYIFLKTCLHQQLNPFLHEAYLIKYDKARPASIVIGKEVFTQRAERHPRFQAMTAGIVVERDGVVKDVPGALPLKGDVLLGAWASVKRGDRNEPFYVSVSLAEYDTGQSNWRTKKATMIRKVALVQALREAFPSRLVGLYDEAEMGDTVDDDGISGYQDAEGDDPENFRWAPEGEPGISGSVPATEREFLAWMMRNGHSDGEHPPLNMPLRDYLAMGCTLEQAYEAFQAAANG